MATPVTSKPLNRRYLGNRHTTEVHDLQRETALCQIREIVMAGHAVVFTPDAPAQANAEGYDNCAYCLGGSTR